MFFPTLHPILNPSPINTSRVVISAPKIVMIEKTYKLEQMMNTSYQDLNNVSSREIDKQVKRAEIKQKYITGVKVTHSTAKKSIWEVVRNIFTGR